MPKSVAVPRRVTQSALVAMCLKGARRRASNDNGAAVPEPDARSDMLLAAALRCLSEHGLRAAKQAHDLAEHAFIAGDRASFDWWLGVCRMLDRRMARGLADRLAIRDAVWKEMVARNLMRPIA